MLGMGQGGDNCPFEFNFDEKTFKPGDLVSYRVSGGTFEGFPFVGTLVEVHDDHVLISPDPNKPETYRGTRESRPLVDESEI